MDRPDSLDEKLLSAIDRLGSALGVARQSIATASGLTPLQVRVIERLAGKRSAQQRIGDIAEELGVSSPTASDSIAALEAKDLVTRTPDPADRRVTMVSLTAAGHEKAQVIAEQKAPIRKVVTSWDPANRDAALTLLLESIASLHRAGVITIDRSCLTCVHYDPKDGARSAHCRLLDIQLTPACHRLDCPEHTPAPGRG